MPNTWMVRAGRDARFLEDFESKNLVAIGWDELGDLAKFSSKKEIQRAVKAKWPEFSDGKVIMTASQLFRFANEISPQDHVVTYDPSARQYFVGKISGDYLFDTKYGSGLTSLRKVSWLGKVDRDELSLTSRNSLGAISTLFKLPSDAADDVHAALTGSKPTAEASADNDPELAEDNLFEEMVDKALEFTKDRINKLDWEEMQDLVAGLLRGMGYKTQVSPAGPDQGKDIIASPDGFGFEQPRIVAEVKHRKGPMGSKEIRSFLGGRHKDDRGLYVSTGGFTKDAKYEAERANIPLMLMDLDALATALIKNYENVDIDTKQLLPLKRVYWPA